MHGGTGTQGPGVRSWLRRDHVVKGQDRGVLGEPPTGPGTVVRVGGDGQERQDRVRGPHRLNPSQAPAGGAPRRVARPAGHDHGLPGARRPGHPVVIGPAPAALAVGPVHDLPAVPAAVTVTTAYRHRVPVVTVVGLTGALPLDLLPGPDVEEVRVLHQLEEPATRPLLLTHPPVASELGHAQQPLRPLARARDLDGRGEPDRVAREVLRGLGGQARHETEHLVNRPLVGVRVLSHREHDRVRRRDIRHLEPRHGRQGLLSDQADRDRATAESAHARAGSRPSSCPTRPPQPAAATRRTLPSRTPGSTPAVPGSARAARPATAPSTPRRRSTSPSSRSMSSSAARARRTTSSTSRPRHPWPHTTSRRPP